ncbi:MAG: hypothetical protein K6D96_08345 [Acetatifactor sp.]|nr:hypothetical protein [Acetatifactor sp.]
MLTYEKVFNLDTDKKRNLVNTALANGIGSTYLEAFMNEAKSTSTINFPKLKAVITNNYYCYYGDFKKSICIVPIADIVNVYSGNMFFNKYDYEQKGIVVETRENKKLYTAKVSRDYEKDDYDEALNILIKRCLLNEGNLIA